MPELEMTGELGSKEELRSLIAKAPEQIQQELTGDSGNPWSACFKSVIAGIYGRLRLGRSCKFISDAEFERMQTALKQVEDKSREVAKQYNWNPPEDLRQELIKALGSIVDEKK